LLSFIEGFVTVGYHFSYISNRPAAYRLVLGELDGSNDFHGRAIISYFTN